jgi:hypothetical protein
MSGSMGHKYSIVSRYPDKLQITCDGPYYFVEITDSIGRQYLIEAYGRDAVELCLEHANFSSGKLISKLLG